MNKSLGFLYLAKRPCGRVSAMAWDVPGHEKSTQKAVTEWQCRGDTIERVERFANDPIPEQICSPHCTECRNQTIKPQEPT